MITVIVNGCNGLSSIPERCCLHLERNESNNLFPPGIDK